MTPDPTITTEPERDIFSYRGYLFFIDAQTVNAQSFRPVVILAEGPAVAERITLPDDTVEIAYGTRAEALRHAEQQAMRWVHDRTGTGQAQF
jgi:hypothetical protein